MDNNSLVGIRDQARLLVTKALDTFVETLRFYIIAKLQHGIHDQQLNSFQFFVEYQDNYIRAAQNSGPLDKMNGLEQPGKREFPRSKISENPENWDLLILINIFHDFYDSVFGKLTFNLNSMLTRNLLILGKDFIGNEAKGYLLTIKKYRNKRAHDGTFDGRDTHFLCEQMQRFFELLKHLQADGETLEKFNSLRIQALELYVQEETIKRTCKDQELIHQQQQVYYDQQIQYQQQQQNIYLQEQQLQQEQQNFLQQQQQQQFNYQQLQQQNLISPDQSQIILNESLISQQQNIQQSTSSAHRQYNSQSSYNDRHSSEQLLQQPLPQFSPIHNQNESNNYDADMMSHAYIEEHHIIAPQQIIDKYQ